MSINDTFLSEKKFKNTKRLIGYLKRFNKDCHLGEWKFSNGYYYKGAEILFAIIHIYGNNWCDRYGSQILTNCNILPQRRQHIPFFLLPLIG